MKRTFYKLTFSTIVAVYLLILVGGVVRSTGSGMGCPDWPKCFGNWVPPTSVEELPPDYKQFYSEYRHRKNEKFARYLVALGMEETAEKLLEDKSVRVEADFNATKTWIEYINRLVGVVIGFLIFAVFVYSIRFLGTQRKLTVVAFATFVLVGFQGWIGSVVVSTNLTPWTITVHMFLALVIVALLVYMLSLADGPSAVAKHSNATIYILASCMVFLLIQILLGTRVREVVDVVAAQQVARETWISRLGMTFIVHRSFSWAVLLVHVLLLVKLRKTVHSNRFALILFLLILGTILTGAGMAWFGIPPALQPVHLVLATATFGIQFLYLLSLTRSTQQMATTS